MHDVYILRSVGNPRKTYIGQTGNLRRRLKDHNSGYCKHTKQFMPWNIEMYLAFSEENKAKDFERYLKSGSGREFSKRHFM